MSHGAAHTTKSRVEVYQPNAGDLNVTVDNFPPQDVFQNLPHYQTLPDGVTTVVWTPASGNKIHMVSFVVSTPSAGVVTIYDRTPPATDSVIMALDFNNRQSMPFGLNTDLDFAKGHVLTARWTQDAPGGGTASITAIGHEHAVP